MWIHAEQDLRGFLADYLISSPSFLNIVKFDRGEMEEKRIGVIVFLGIVESTSHVPDPGKKLILHLYSANPRNTGKGSVVINSSEGHRRCAAFTMINTTGSALELLSSSFSSTLR